MKKVIGLIMVVATILAFNVSAKADMICKMENTTNEELTEFITTISELYMEKMVNGEIESFKFGTDKNGQLYVTSFKPEKFSIFNTGMTVYYDYYIK